MSDLKAYLMGRDGKLEAWVSGGLVPKFKILDGRIHLRDGDHKVDPRFFFRVGFEPWWAKAIVLGFAAGGMLVGIAGGLLGILGGMIGGLIVGVVFRTIRPIEKEI